MSKRKFHYYVLVITPEGPVYVTSIINKTKTAYWRKKETPLEMTREDAVSLCIGLNINGTSSNVVCSPFTISDHPYNYTDFSIKIEKKK